MEIQRIPKIMQDTSRTLRRQGKRIGFIPTMGALHEGHLSLVRMSKQENDITIVSIYVNPKQFGPSEDLSKYPRDTEGDADKLRKSAVDILFIPADQLIYPAGFSTHVNVDGLSEKLCGAFRPQHFVGVATIVAKLFNLIQPDRAYFGRKDFQQVVIIERLVKDLDMGIEVISSPTIREADGLAMSSRNAYLSGEERKAAGLIYKTLTEAAEAVKSGIIEVDDIKHLMLGSLKAEPLISEIQYCSAYDPATLEELDRIEKGVLLAVALKIGTARLIDNLLVQTGRQGER